MITVCPAAVLDKRLIVKEAPGALDEVSYYSFAFNADQVTYHQLADPPHFPRGRSPSARRPVKHPKPKPKPKRHRRVRKD